MRYTREYDAHCIKFTRAINGAIVVASFAVCRYLKQVTIKSRVQITKWYSKVILSWMYFLPIMFVANRSVDEHLKWLHCCVTHSNRHRRHHHRHRYALYTVVHFYLQCHPHRNHHLVNYFPNLMERKERRRHTRPNDMKRKIILKLWFVCSSGGCNHQKTKKMRMTVNVHFRWIKCEWNATSLTSSSKLSLWCLVFLANSISGR